MECPEVSCPERYSIKNLEKDGKDTVVEILRKARHGAVHMLSYHTARGTAEQSLAFYIDNLLIKAINDILKENGTLKA